jgi:hypothetical protein
MITKADIPKYTFQEYRRIVPTRISDEVLQIGTQVEILGSVYTCTEPSRLAIDVSGNVYPVAESVFKKSYSAVEVSG